MSSPSREHMLGYLLGALERTDHEQVEAELETNPLLREELRRLESCLGRVGLACAGQDKDPQLFEPPAGLALRTCRLVAAGGEAKVRPARLGWGASVLEHPRRFSWSDIVASAAVLVAAAVLFFPALAHSRFQAEIASCQNHLRQLGYALHEYSSLQPDKSFPRIELAGNRGVAGAYAPILVGNQLVSDSRTFLCPSSATSRRASKLHVPTPEELDKLSGEMLENYQQSMGGDYGYNMGYLQDGQVIAPTDLRRPNYVLMSDAPSNELPSRRSANHGGAGQNVLYEDGHVQFVSGPTWPEQLDDPFYNLERRVAAGLAPSDHVIGASGDRP